MSPLTPSERGLAISALVLGVLVAICAIPAGIMCQTAQLLAFFPIAVLPFALIALIMGVTPSSEYTKVMAKH